MKYKERIIWMATTAALVIAFIFTAVSPMKAYNFRSKNDGYIDDLAKLFNFIENNYIDEVSSQQLFEGAAKGLFESLNDPYSVYLTIEDMKGLSDTSNGSFGGVGMHIHRIGGAKPKYSPDMTFRERYFDFVEIVAPMEGTPAFKAGLKAGDFIISVNDESTKGLTSSEVADLIRGKPGTSVDITIIRRGDIKKKVTLKRAIIEVPTTKYAMLDDKTALLRIISWTPNTPENVEKAINYFKSKNYESIIIDVRGNPGGLLSSVVNTTDLFLGSGIIVSTKDRNMVTLEKFSASPRVAIPEDIPIIILTDNGSASASEIFTGALKDNGRALIVGGTTFGKGSVQQIHDFRDSGFKLTISRYYTPGDYNIDKIGIEPDVKIDEDELTDDELISLSKLFEENSIEKFVEENPVEDTEKTNNFVADIKKIDSNINDRILRRLIRQEYNRTADNPPIFDLEFDTVLKKALNIFKTNEYDSLRK